MIEVKKQWKKAVAAALNNLIQGRDVQADPVRPEELIMETPPRPEMGDLAFPMFPFARILRGSPGEIAGSAARLLGRDEAVEGLGEALAAGPYLNVRLDIAGVGTQVFAALEEQGEGYGHTQTLNNTRIMVEFSCPNTNKPLHLGHLRNDSLGHAISQILKANGAEVRRVNLINDRGIHICKSMAAYRRFGGGRTPESEGIKGDHFVGDYYVRYNEWSREDATAEKQARKLLKDWEAGDPEAHKLWELMNSWALKGIRETYSRTDIAFEKIYYESETFSRGREEILKGVEAGVFHKNQDGSVQIDLEEINLDKKVLLRSDGTSLYLTQDIGTAIARHGDWPFERLIYVVGAEQKYHFQVLFHILDLLGFPWARRPPPPFLRHGQPTGGEDEIPGGKGGRRG